MTSERSDQPGDPGEATTVVEILAGYAAAGYDTEMRITADGTIRCQACGREHRPADVHLDSFDRVPDLVDKLIAGGVRLTRVEPHHPTLEELYFAVRRERRAAGVATPL